MDRFFRDKDGRVHLVLTRAVWRRLRKGVKVVADGRRHAFAEDPHTRVPRLFPVVVTEAPLPEHGEGTKVRQRYQVTLQVPVDIELELDADHPAVRQSPREEPLRRILAEKVADALDQTLRVDPLRVRQWIVCSRMVEERIEP